MSFADLIEVDDNGSEIDRTITTDVKITVRRWLEVNTEQCWLIVNDHKEVVSMTRDQLRALGLACIQAATGDGKESPS